MNLNFKGGNMITKKSSCLISLSLLLFPMIAIAADSPIIFVHGQQADGKASTGVGAWNPSDPEQQTAMKKIIGYEGYQYGLKNDNTPAVDCDETTVLKSNQGAKRIFNFSYYHTDGSPGAIGSNGQLIPSGSYESTQYANNISQGTWAENLKDFINKVRAATDADKVNIIAHSMGGLVTKSAITYYGCESKVSKFLMVGTPNHGVETDWKVCAALDLASRWETWLHLGEGLELGVDKELLEIRVYLIPPYIELTWGAQYNTTFEQVDPPYEAGGWCQLLNDEWEERIQSGDINVDFSIITGDRDPFASPFGYSGTNDGVLKKSWCVPVEGSSFEPTIYASHSHMDAIAVVRKSAEEETCLTECTYTTEFIKKWIIDDVVLPHSPTPNDNLTVWPGLVADYEQFLDFSDAGLSSWESVLSTSISVFDELGENVSHLVGKGIGWHSTEGLLDQCFYPVLCTSPEVFPSNGEYFVKFKHQNMQDGDVTEGEYKITVLDHEGDPASIGLNWGSTYILLGAKFNLAERTELNSAAPGLIEIEGLTGIMLDTAYFYRYNSDPDYHECVLDVNGYWTIPFPPAPATGTFAQCKIKAVANLDPITTLFSKEKNIHVFANTYCENQKVRTDQTRTIQACNLIKAAGKDNHDADTYFIIENGGICTMEAGVNIKLLPGFEAQEGCDFHAFMHQFPLSGISTNMASDPIIASSFNKSEEDSLKTSTELSSKETKEIIPTVFSCAQNYPNPFMSNTTIKYGLPKNCDNVNLTIFNIAGQAVRTLVNGQESAGFKSVRWNGKNSAGTQVPQGIYFYVFKADDFEKHHKMILLK
jgi:pimeloyl-ACP methyl ester carboxylesterase